MKSAIIAVCMVLAAIEAWAAMEDWSQTARTMYYASVVTAAFDVVSTQRALDDGATESNPIYGHDPTLWRLIGIKCGFVAARYLIVDYLPENWRKAFLGSQIGMELGAGYINLQGGVRW